MKIKVGDLKRIIREVAEEAAGGKSTEAMSAALDDLADTWNEWSSMEAKTGPGEPFTGTSGYARGDLMSAVKRALRGGASDSPEASDYAAKVKAIPWPTDDVQVRAALVQPWISSYGAPAVASFLSKAGFEVPTPRVKLARSLFSGHGSDWKGIVLGGLDYKGTVEADSGVRGEDLAMRVAADKAAKEKRLADQKAAAAARRKAARAAAKD